MATKGVLLQDGSDTILPVTSSDLIQVKYGDDTKVLTTLLQEIEEVSATTVNSIVLTAQEAHNVYYAIESSTLSSAASEYKQLQLSNNTFEFLYQTGDILHVKFYYTNTSYEGLCFIIDDGADVPVFRIFNGQIIPVTGAFIQKDYNYKFMYVSDTGGGFGEGFILLDSDFHTNDVIEMCAVKDANAMTIGEHQGGTSIYLYNELTGEYYGSPTSVPFNPLQNLRVYSPYKIDKNIDKYKVILTCASSLNYVNSICDTTVDTTAYDAIEPSVNKSFVMRNIIENKKLYFNFSYYYSGTPTNTGFYPVYSEIEFSNSRSAKMNKCFQYGEIEKQYVVPCDITNSNVSKESLGSINSYTASLRTAVVSNDSTWGNKIQYNANKYRIKLNQRHGVVMGIPHKYNMTNSNVAVKYYDTNFNESETTTCYTMMQYQTPCVYVTNTATSGTAASNNCSYYSFTYNGYIGLCYHSLANHVAYSTCVKGNNYYDVYGDDKEMFYYDGTTLRNYITASVDPNNKNIKTLNNNTVIKYSSTNADVTYIAKNQIKTKNLVVGGTGGVTGNFTMYFNNANANDNYKVTTVGDTIKITFEGDDNYVSFTGLGDIVASSTTSGHGKVTANKFFETSDERFKTNINQLTYNDGINVYSFNFNGSEKTSYGFIAQRVEETNPDLVDNLNDYKTVDYNSTLALLLAQAMNKINELENRITELENGRN